MPTETLLGVPAPPYPQVCVRHPRSPIDQSRHLQTGPLPGVERRWVGDGWGEANKPRRSPSRSAAPLSPPPIRGLARASLPPTWRLQRRQQQQRRRRPVRAPSRASGTEPSAHAGSSRFLLGGQNRPEGSGFGGRQGRDAGGALNRDPRVEGPGDVQGPAKPSKQRHRTEKVPSPERTHGPTGSGERRARRASPFSRWDPQWSRKKRGSRRW